MKRYLADRYRKHILYGGHWISHYSKLSAILMTGLLYYLIFRLVEKILSL